MNAASRSRTVTPIVAALLVLAGTAAISHALDPAPKGVHVSLGADARTEATVAWHTDGLTDPGTAVEWGTTPALGARVEGTGAPAPEDVPVVLHEVWLTGLPAGDLVYYRAGSDAAWSPVRTFRTAPTESRFRFTVFGDHGTKTQARKTTALTLEAEPDLHLIAGDLSYANSQPAVWNEWLEQNESLFATRPLMPAPGNHETETTQTGNGAVTYLSRFALPGTELYYSFDYGRVHFTVFHSTVDADPAIMPPQIAWMDEDLRAAAARRDAGELDFLVVIQHHPLWANHKDQDLQRHYLERRTNPPLIALEEQMLVRYGVDILIAGHNHHYERTKPMAYGKSTDARTTGYQDPSGYIGIVSGGGGTSLYEFRDPGDFPEWSAKHARRYHFVQFDIDGPNMTVTAYATDDDAPREVLDTFTLSV